MPTTPFRRAHRAATALALALAGVLALAASPALATFPGENGQIVFEDEGYGISAIHPDGTGLHQLDAGTGYDEIGFLHKASDPQVSPDGKKVAYLLDGTVKVIDIEGGSPVTLVSGGAVYGPWWSPDGSRLAFSGSIGTPGPEGGATGLYTVTASGGAPKRLTTSKPICCSPTTGDPYSPSVTDAAWSADGSQIAYTVSESEGDIYEQSDEVLVVDAAEGESGGLERITATSQGSAVRGVTWSPTREQIVFARNPEATTGGRYDLYTSGPSGPATRLTPSGEGAPQYRFPSFSADGEELLTARASIPTGAALLDRDGSNLRTIFEGPAAATSPGSISPDGQKVAIAGSPINLVPEAGGAPASLGVTGSNLDWGPAATDCEEAEAWGAAAPGCVFTVNRSSDEADASVGDQTCDVDPEEAGDQCTLRAAVEEANADGKADLVAFQIEGSGRPVIAPESPLPPITRPLKIDGSTQPGTASGEPGVELEGAAAGEGANGIELSGAASVVRGLQIDRFGGAGIEAGGEGGHKIAGNWIGFEAPGGATSPPPAMAPGCSSPRPT